MQAEFPFFKPVSESEFFNAVKSDKKLLSQVQGGEKYKNVGDSGQLTSGNI